MERSMRNPPGGPISAERNALRRRAAIQIQNATSGRIDRPSTISGAAFRLQRRRKFGSMSRLRMAGVSRS